MSKQYAHLHAMAKTSVKFQNDWPKTVGGVALTSQLLMNWRADEQMNGRVMARLYRTCVLMQVRQQQAHGPRLTHLSEIATADMHLLCNMFSILSLQLRKGSLFKQFLVLKKKKNVKWTNLQAVHLQSNATFAFLQCVLCFQRILFFFFRIYCSNFRIRCLNILGKYGNSLALFSIHHFFNTLHAG